MNPIWTWFFHQSFYFYSVGKKVYITIFLQTYNSIHACYLYSHNLKNDWQNNEYLRWKKLKLLWWYSDMSTQILPSSYRSAANNQIMLFTQLKWVQHWQNMCYFLPYVKIKFWHKMCKNFTPLSKSNCTKLTHCSSVFLV